MTQEAKDMLPNITIGDHVDRADGIDHSQSVESTPYVALEIWLGVGIPSLVIIVALLVTAILMPEKLLELVRVVLQHARDVLQHAAQPRSVAPNQVNLAINVPAMNPQPSPQGQYHNGGNEILSQSVLIDLMPSPPAPRVQWV